MIEITFLADRPETIPILTHWFRAQWPDYYGGRTDADIAQDFHAEAVRVGSPLRLVAFLNGALAGTITLRERAMQATPEYQPGLGGLFVTAQYRGQGIGTALVNAGMHTARAQGYKQVYTATAAARGILLRLGWKPIETISHNDEPLVIYVCHLG